MTTPHLRVPQTSHKTAGIVLVIVGSGQIGAVFCSGKEPDYKHVGKVPITIALWPIILTLVSWLNFALLGITLIAL